MLAYPASPHMRHVTKWRCPFKIWVLAVAGSSFKVHMKDQHGQFWNSEWETLWLWLRTCSTKCLESLSQYLIGFGTWLLPFRSLQWNNKARLKGWKACLALDHTGPSSTAVEFCPKTFFSHWRYRNGPSPQRDKWGTPQNTCWDVLTWDEMLSSLSSKQSSHPLWCYCTIHAAARPLLALIHSVTCILLSWLVLAPSLHLISSVFWRNFRLEDSLDRNDFSFLDFV